MLFPRRIRLPPLRRQPRRWSSSTAVSCQVSIYADDQISRRAFFPSVNDAPQAITFQSARLNSFTEEKLRFSLPKQAYTHQPSSMTYLNNVLYILTSNPFGIYSIANLPTSARDPDIKEPVQKKSQRGAFRRWLYLDEVLPFQASAPTLSSFQDKLLMFLPSLRMVITFPPSGGMCQIIRLPAVKGPKRQRNSGIFQSLFSSNDAAGTCFNDSLRGEGRYVASYGNNIVDVLQLSTLAELGKSGVNVAEKVVLERVHMAENVSISGVSPLTKDRFLLTDSLNSERYILDRKLSNDGIARFTSYCIDRRKVDIHGGISELELEDIDTIRGVSVNYRPDIMSHPMALLQRISGEDQEVLEVLTTPFANEREELEVVKSVMGRNGSILTLRRGEDGASCLDVVDLANNATLQIPVTAAEAPQSPIDLCSLPDGDCAVAFSSKDASSIDFRIYQSSKQALDAALNDWKRMLGLHEPSEQGGNEQASLRLEVSGDPLISESPPPLDEPKHGKEDPSNAPHVGGNTWAGGTGGSNTAGLGGRGGPYRLDKGHPVHQVSEAAKREVDSELAGRMRELNRKAFKERLQEIDMTSSALEEYEGLLSSVEREVEQLRLVLATLDWKTHERVWVKNKAHGELDDAKLIDGMTGEKLIFKTREEQAVEARHPKRMIFLMDLSGSMYRFNGQDGRLQRQCALAVMLMEALQGVEERLQYAMVGHSGEDDAIELVRFGHPPANAAQRLQVVQRMVAHSQFCMSGDMTLEAVQRAVHGITEEEADDYFVFVISDANLRRYGIPPSRLAESLTSHPDVNAFAIFIASIGEEADRIQREMPRGKGFTCFDTAQLPHLFKEIFTSQVLHE